MSIFNLNNPMPKIITTMEESDLHFYASGSRYFGTAQPDSDWDFFVQADEGVHKTLTNMGFGVDCNEHYYNDLNTKAVYSCGKVQVAVVKDAQMREAIQAQLRSNPNELEAYYNLRKFHRTAWWNVAYLGYQASQANV